MMIYQYDDSDLSIGFWYCDYCGTENSKLDGKCQYCDAGTKLDSWTRPKGSTEPCPDCGSTTCRGYYKPDGNHLLAF